MTRQEAIEKAKRNIYTLTEYKWKDLCRTDYMEQRLIGIVEFISFSYNISVKEYTELNNYMQERLEYWKKNN